MRKRASLEQRMAKLICEIEGLAAGPSTNATRRTLAGKRAALHVMEKVREAGQETTYCKAEDNDAQRPE